MNTPTWMIDAATATPRRAKAARRLRRSTDRRSLKVVHLTPAFAAMLVTTWLFTQLSACFAEARRINAIDVAVDVGAASAAILVLIAELSDASTWRELEPAPKQPDPSATRPT